MAIAPHIDKAPAMLQRCCGTKNDSPEHDDEQLTLSRHSTGDGPEFAPAMVNDVLRSAGQPLDASTSAAMGARFGHDFSRVRVHSDRRAASSASAVAARAYTVGQHVVFGAGEYQPGSPAGQRLLAHELAHVVQQRSSGPVPARLRIGAAGGPLERQADSLAAQVLSERSPAAAGAATPTGATVQRCGPIACDCSPEERAAKEDEQSLQRMPIQGGPILQRAPAQQSRPGDGMNPPGDCTYREFIPLRMAVVSAKAVTGMLGGCHKDDSCTFLAAKIAAISAEIAARMALDYTCFKGGNAGHYKQIEGKLNGLNNCYELFNSKNCPGNLISAMDAVVARARQVIQLAMMAVAAVVVVAALAALVEAIIALLEIIAAALAAAAEAATILAAVAAMTALLATIRGSFSSEAPSSSGKGG